MATNKPKQMTAYDKFQVVSDEEYILCDDAYHNGEEEETICENPLRDLEECAYCSTQLIKVENNTLEKRCIATIASGIVKNVASGRHAFILHSVLVCHHQIIGLISQNYGSLIQTYLKDVVKN